jgi:hypothetical protein
MIQSLLKTANNLPGQRETQKRKTNETVYRDGRRKAKIFHPLIRMERSIPRMGVWCVPVSGKHFLTDDAKRALKGLC